MSVKYMKLGFEDLVIDENNFYNLKINNKVVGFNLDLRLNYYRGLPVSCLEKLSVTVDGQVIPQHLMLFCINGKKFSMEQIPQLFAEYWGINTIAQLYVYNNGLEEGEHQVDIEMILRCPYMQFAPRIYGMIDSSCSKTMVLKEGVANTKRVMPLLKLDVKSMDIQSLKGIDFAVSLYGFTERFIADDNYGFEEMFQDLKSLGIKKFEIVGAQMFQSYPHPTDEEINTIIELAKKYDVTPFSYGGYVDMGKFSDHDMSDAEIVNEMVYEMMTAKRLGCTYVRAPYLPAKLWPQINMFAQIYGVKVGYEVHAPERPSDGHIQELATVFKELDSPNIGFIPDFGCYIERPNELSINRFVNMGAKKELLDFIIANRWNGYTFETMSEKLKEMGGSDAEKSAAADWFGFMSFAPADLEGFKTIVPYALYFHGKFYHIGEDCVETTIPYEELLKIIVGSGFKGTVLTEYEGHAFYLNDAVEQIERHLIMEKNILEKL
jgi:hypothetical protein